MSTYNNTLSNKGKAGIITPGATPKTLDGINLDWLYKTARQIENGTYIFNKVRILEITKTKGKIITLGNNSPR